ncbi:MAG: hypothetical protein IPK83_22550 [Planctomycetes bacterium]|nr:hypothetical protein [Planctomycetota bacterium]
MKVHRHPPAISFNRPVLSAALALAAAIFAAPSARAAHIVEFQMSSAKLIQLVEHRLLEEEICALSPFELPLQSGDFILDHVEFPGPVTIQRTGAQVQFVVPVEIFTKAYACISDPNCLAVDYSPSAPLAAQLVLDLNAQLDEDNKLNLCVEFNSMKIGGAVVNLTSLDETLVQSLGGLLAPKCSKVDVMKSLSKLLNGERTVKQVGVSAITDLSRIAVRIELDDPANPEAAPASSWSAFFSTEIAPTAEGMEWSIFMDQSLLKQALAAKFHESLSSAQDVEVLDGPHASYMPFATAGAQVTLTMELEIDAGCPFNNVGVDPAIVTLHLFADNNDPNAIKSHGQISTDLVDSDVVACALSFGPFGLIGLPVIAAVAANQGPGESDFPDECNQINDEEFQCKQPVTLPVIRLSKWNATWSSRATLTLNKLFGHTSGIIMGGPVNVTLGLPHAPKDLLSVAAGKFSYGVQGGCSSLHLGWSGYLPIEGDGRLCDVKIIDDPRGVYGVSKNWSPHALGGNWIGDNRILDLEFPRIGSNYAAFVQNPYPCKLVIRTSAGSRCVEVPAPDIAHVNPAAAAGALALAKANCLKPFWFSLRIMEMFWLVDPPPFDIQTQIRFTDPFVYTQNAAARVVNMQLNFNEPVSTRSLGGSVQFTGVTMNVLADVRIDRRSVTPMTRRGINFGPAGGVGFNGIQAGPIGGAGFVPLSGKTQQAARELEQDDELPVTIQQEVVIDLQALMGDGSVAELTPQNGISQLVTVPPDQLPEGVAELSFMLEIPVERLKMQAEMEPVEIEPADEPAGDAPIEEEAETPEIPTLDQACGGGACGVGGAGAVPFMLLGWMGLRGRRRSRKSCHKRGSR